MQVKTSNKAESGNYVGMCSLDIVGLNGQEYSYQKEDALVGQQYWEPVDSFISLTLIKQKRDLPVLKQ